MARRLGSFALGLILPAVLFVVWWFVSADSESPYFPPLRKILSTFKDVWFFDRFTADLVPSVWHFAAGFAIAVVVGMLLGALVGLSGRVRRDISPVTEFCRSMPIAAVVPVALITVGAGAKMEISLIAFACTWPILLSTADGVRGVEPVTLDLARVYGLSRAQMMRTVLLPGAMPRVFAGLRIALAIGIATMIVSNMFGSSNGLGYFVVVAQQSYDVAQMWAGILMIGIIGAIVSVCFVVVEHRVLAWHRGWRLLTKETR